MWVFDAKGKRTEATEENAAQMIVEGGGYSVLWPRGTPEQEAAEFEALLADPSLASAIMRANLPAAPAEPAIVQPEPASPHPKSRSRRNE